MHPLLRTWSGRALLATAALLAPWSAAQGQDWPRSPLKIVVPFPPGGIDIVTRLIADRLAQQLGQPVLVEHRPGAAGNIAMESVARSPADGSTWLMTNAILAVNPALYKIRYDPLRDLVPVVPVARMPLLVYARRDLPADDPESLTRALRQAPAGLSCGNAGGGTRLTCEMLAQHSGAKVLSVPFKGLAPAMTELAAGRLDLAIGPAQVGRALSEEGRIKAIARTTAEDGTASTVAASVRAMQGLALDTWYGLFAPAGTDPQWIARINREVNALLADPDTHRRVEALEMQVTGGSADSLARQLQSDIERYRRIATQAGLQPE